MCVNNLHVVKLRCSVLVASMYAYAIHTYVTVGVPVTGIKSIYLKMFDQKSLYIS